MVRALASHQCGPGSTPGVDTICGLSLLLVLSLAPRGFSPGTPISPFPQKPTFPNSNSTRNQVDEEPLCGCGTCKSLFRGESRIFFRRGCTRLLLYFNTNKPHRFFFCFFFLQNTSCIRKPQVISVGGGGGGCAPPAPFP